MKQRIKRYLNPKKIALVVFGTILTAIQITYFVQPVGLFTGGASGLALIIVTLTNNKVTFGIVYLLMNLPLLFISWFKLGRRFTFYTIISVLTLSFVTTILPDIELISDDLLIMSLFGGIIGGIGISLTLKAGGSCAGSDIIALYLSERTGKPIGTYGFAINAFVLSLSAILFDLEIALYTVIGSYVTSLVIDKIHTRYRKLTVTVNTDSPDELIKEYQTKSKRGITILNAIGAYTGKERKLLYIVITSYELTPFIDLVRKHDPNAFINVNKSEKVFGAFHKVSIEDD